MVLKNAQIVLPPPAGGSSNESFQPDPRWADQLAQLKEMLAASSNN